jgi:hypothetical protein
MACASEQSALLEEHMHLTLLPYGPSEAWDVVDTHVDEACGSVASRRRLCVAKSLPFAPAGTPGAASDVESTTARMLAAAYTKELAAFPTCIAEDEAVLTAQPPPSARIAAAVSHRLERKRLLSVAVELLQAYADDREAV